MLARLGVKNLFIAAKRWIGCGSPQRLRTKKGQEETNVPVGLGGLRGLRYAGFCGVQGVGNPLFLLVVTQGAASWDPCCYSVVVVVVAVVAVVAVVVVLAADIPAIAGHDE